MTRALVLLISIAVQVDALGLLGNESQTTFYDSIGPQINIVKEICKTAPVGNTCTKTVKKCSFRHVQGSNTELCKCKDNVIGFKDIYDLWIQNGGMELCSSNGNGDGNSFGIVNETQFGSANGNQFGNGNNNSFGTGNGNSFGIVNGTQFGTGNGNSFGIVNATEFGAENGNSFGIVNATQFNDSNGNRFSRANGTSLGVGSEMTIGGQKKTNFYDFLEVQAALSVVADFKCCFGKELGLFDRRGSPILDAWKQSAAGIVNEAAKAAVNASIESCSSNVDMCSPRRFMVCVVQGCYQTLTASRGN